MKVQVQKPPSILAPRTSELTELLSPDSLFRGLASKIKAHPFCQTADHTRQKQPSGLLLGQKQIKPRMFSKVVSWMQNLCFETLGFGCQTFEMSAKILKKYLEITDEPPKALQMIGCACLHIASKLNQKTIISIQSYIDCCMNIFNKQQFQLKQVEVYQKVAYSIPLLTLSAASDFIEFEILANGPEIEIKQKVIRQTLLDMARDLQFLEFDPITIATNLWVELFINENYDYDKAQFLTVLKTRQIQY